MINLPIWTDLSGVRRLGVDATPLYGPFTACDCRPFCGLPPCDGCGEDHGGHDRGGRYLCRDCDLDENMASMQCSGCKRMRYRANVLGGVGEYLWGEPCRCEPRPPSMLEARR